jgi:diamine N-acetyltransferase
MTSPGVHLREITDDNRDAVRALRVRRHEKQFVASVSKSLKEAAKTPAANPWYRAVYRGDEPVGFAMLSGTHRLALTGGGTSSGACSIDKRYQRCGIGQQVLTQIADLVHADGASEVLTRYEPGKANPGPSTSSSASSPPERSTAARSCCGSASPLGEDLKTRPAV